MAGIGARAGLSGAADRPFPDVGDCGEGVARIVAERVEHVCGESSPGLRCGSSGCTGDSSVGKDQYLQIGVVEVGADDAGRLNPINKHERRGQGSLVLGREDLGPEQGRQERIGEGWIFGLVLQDEHQVSRERFPGLGYGLFGGGFGAVGIVAHRLVEHGLDQRVAGGACPPFRPSWRYSSCAQSFSPKRVRPPTIAQLDVPEPGEGEVRVQIHAASLNGFDLAVAAGYLTGMMKHRCPVVLGKDFAGVVDAVGPGVTGYATGDRVFGVVTRPYLGDGSFGEYVVVPVAVGLAKLPASVGFLEGASLGLAGTAALDAVDAAELEPGQVVLVVGATGGVGTQVVQLAAQAGARVIATAHTDEERALVTGLRAGDVVDHTEDVAKQVGPLASGGVDVVVHLAGDPGPLLPVVRDGGRFVSTLIGSPDQVPAENLTVLAVAANPAPRPLTGSPATRPKAPPAWWSRGSTPWTRYPRRWRTSGPDPSASSSSRPDDLPPGPVVRRR